MRDKEAIDHIDINTTRLKAPKIRCKGKGSPYAGEYYYDNATHTIHDKKQWMKENSIEGECKEVKKPSAFSKTKGVTRK